MSKYKKAKKWSIENAKKYVQNNFHFFPCPLVGYGGACLRRRRSRVWRGPTWGLRRRACRTRGQAGAAGHFPEAFWPAFYLGPGWGSGGGGRAGTHTRGVGVGGDPPKPWGGGLTFKTSLILEHWNLTTEQFPWWNSGNERTSMGHVMSDFWEQLGTFTPPWVTFSLGARFDGKSQEIEEFI